jgi:CRP-like cAMP-binding protein
MQIDVDTLLAYGAIPKIYKKGDVIFLQGNDPRYFYQINVGIVKLISIANDTKEYIQGVFENGNSFGEPPLMLSKPYPASAYAITETVTYRLSKDKFLHLIEDHPIYFKKLFYLFTNRLYFKSLAANILVNNSPEEKLIAFFEKIKAEFKLTENGMVPYTRQQIADFTGLRVETVIRTLTKLVEKQVIVNHGHKVYYK